MKGLGRVGEAAECQEINSNNEGEDRDHKNTDIEARRPRKQIGLDTLLVLAVNYEY